MTEPQPEESTPVDGTAVPHALRGVAKWLWVSVLLLWGAVVVIAWGSVSQRDAFQTLGLFMFMGGMVTTLITYLFVLIEPGLFSERAIRIPLTISFAGFVLLSLITLGGQQAQTLSFWIHLIGLAAALILYIFALHRNARGLFIVALIVLFLTSIPW